MTGMDRLPLDGQRRYPIWALIFLAALYASISFVNHCCFRTFGLDLGLYTNALYDYAHFRFNDSSSFRPVAENLLGDHFDLLLPLISPLSWLFRSWTLLIVQWLALLVGALGVYRFAHMRTGRFLDANLLLLVYGLHFGVIGSVGFDYHSNVIAAALLPWYFVGLQERRWRLVWSSFILILFARENMSLWMIFVTTGACWYFRESTVRRKLLLQCFIAVVWFIAATAWWMPHLHTGGVLSQFRYSVLGGDLWSAFITFLSKPGLVIRTLFTDHLPVAGYKPGIKQEFWLIFLLSGAWIFLRVPVFLWMALPILLQKLLNDQVQVWGVNDHYNAELAPLIGIGGAFVLGSIQRQSRKNFLLAFLLIVGIAATIRTMDRAQAFVRRENIRIYQAPHWKPVANPAAVKAALQLIPDTAAVSAHTNLHPYISWRDRAFIFPRMATSDFVLLLEQGSPYPLDSSAYRNLVDSLKSSAAWRIDLELDGVLLLHHR